MSQAVQQSDRYYSREEYRQWYDAQPHGRFERIDGRIVAMSAERIAHVRMKGAVYKALERAVAQTGVQCEAFGDGVTVERGDNDYEPDACVNCGPPLSGDAMAVPNPVIVVKVLSTETASTDTGGKLEGYFQAPAVRHYLIVNPIKPVVTVHCRGRKGIHTEIVSSGSIILDPPGITITVEELYTR